MTLPKTSVVLYFVAATFYMPSAVAQVVDTQAHVNSFDTAFQSSRTLTSPQIYSFPTHSFLAPGLMVAYGLTTLKSDPLQDLNEDVKKKIWSDHPHRLWHIDNYLQFVPAAAVYGLNIAGVKGKNNFRDRSCIFLMSNIFLNVTVSSVKKLTQEQRPDGSSFASFPSGHTAEAFANAEFLRQEYKEVSSWYGIAGYVTATATGVLRMYNNKHWLSDVIAGAGVGMASTRLAYWLYPRISKKIFKKSSGQSFIMPTYQNKQAGLSLVYSPRH